MELATFAAKAIVKDALEESTRRINSAVSLLAETNTKLAVTAERVATLNDKIEGYATEDYASRTAKKLVDECSEVHKKDRETSKGFAFDRASLMIALTALGVTATDKIGPLLGRLFGGP